GGTDALAAQEDLVTWLRAARLIGRGVRADATDLSAATALREALRSLLIMNGEGGLARYAWNLLDESAEAARLRLRFSPATRRPRLESKAPGVAGALGALVAIVAAAIDDCSWFRLKGGRPQGCRWALYDHSAAQAGVWCSMSIGGNRTKVGHHRDRRRASG